MPNAADLLCDLSEASEEVFRDCAIDHEFDASLPILKQLGAVGAGPRVESVTCRACDGDHSAAIEFDAERRCYFHSCPEVGLVKVDDDDLATLVFDPEWLVDWLVSGLAISYPARRRTLVSGQVWHLGDAACGDALVTVIFARRIRSQAALDQLASVLGTVQHADRRLVITTSAQVTRQVPLPHGFVFLDLREITRMVGEQPIVDQTRFDILVRAMPVLSKTVKPPIKASPKIRQEPARLDYREADKPFIAEMHAMILDGKARNPTDAARAVARRAPGDGNEASKVTRLATAYINAHRRG